MDYTNLKEVKQRLVFEYNEIKLAINNRKITEKKNPNLEIKQYTSKSSTD